MKNKINMIRIEEIRNLLNEYNNILNKLYSFQNDENILNENEKKNLLSIK